MLFGLGLNAHLCPWSSGQSGSSANISKTLLKGPPGPGSLDMCPRVKTTLKKLTLGVRATHTDHCAVLAC